MYILTCNNYPICISDKTEKLVDKMKQIIEQLSKVDCYTVINKTENTITYYDTFHKYVENVYNVHTIDLI